MTTTAAPVRFERSGSLPWGRQVVRAASVVVLGFALMGFGISHSDISITHGLQIVGIAAAASGLATVVGALAMFAFRYRSLGSQITILVMSAIVGAGVASWAVARAMFLSTHDFSVLVVVLVTAGVWASLGALALGYHVSKSADRLVQATKDLGGSEPLPITSKVHSREMVRLTEELAETSGRLAAEEQRTQSLERSRNELVAWITSDVETVISRIETLSKESGNDANSQLQQELRELRRVGRTLADLHGLDLKR